MNLKLLRKNLGVTQDDVARAINIPKPTYSHYETGRNEPDIQTMIKLANYFNCSLDYLLGYRPQQKKITEQLTDDQKRVMYFVKKMNEKEVIALLGVVARLINISLEEALTLKIGEDFKNEDNNNLTKRGFIDG